MFESMVAVGAPGWFIVPPCVRSVPHVRLPVGARSFPMPLDSLLNRAEGTALRKGPPRGNAPRSEATEGRSRVRLDGCGSVGKPCPASEQLLRGSLGSPPYLVGVDGDDATSLDDPATIDPDVRDIVARRREDQVSRDVEVDSVHHRCHMEAPEVDRDDVGPLAFLQRPRDVRKPKGSRSLERRHREYVPRVAGRWIVGRHLLQERGELHLFEQVEVVVLLLPVGADPDRDPMAAHVPDTSRSRGELHVRTWAVGDARTRLGEELDLAVIQPDAVSHDCPLAEDPTIEELFDRTAAVSLE